MICIYLQAFSLVICLSFFFFAQVLGHSAALSSATQHAILPKFGGKWETEYFNTRLPLPTLLCEGYSVKLIYLLK